MKGKGYLFEIAAIGYLRNDEGDIIETNIIYPITTILSKDYESARFELIRKLSEKSVGEYGSDNIELIVRSLSNASRIAYSSSGVNLVSGTTTSITF